MKEIRGAEAVRYAEEQGISFEVDEDFLARKEAELRGRPATMDDVEEVFEQRLGRRYDPSDVFPGDEGFDFLVGRYGDGWIYVAVEGRDPEEEERAVLGMFRRLLEEPEPLCGGDVLEVAGRYGTLLKDTGFPWEAGSSLMFHAALRLVQRGELEAVTDKVPSRQDAVKSYGNRLFFVPPDVQIPVAGVLCEECRSRVGSSALSLHRECAGRLVRALAGVLDNSPAGSPS